MVELVGSEKLGILKTDKLLICRESYSAHKASNACNAGLIVTAILSQSNYDFMTKSDRNALEGFAVESMTILTSELQSTVAKSRVAEASTTRTQNNSAISKWTNCNHTGASRSTFRMPRPI